MKKLIRITTVPISLKVLLKGQLNFMNNYFETVGVSSPGKLLDEVTEQEGIRTIAVKMTRSISPVRDLISLFQLIRILKKEKPYIVHTHTPKAGLLGMLAARFTKVPVRLHTVAGLPLTVAGGFKRKLLVFIEKLTYRYAHKVYPNSVNLMNFILENNLCKANKLKVIAKGSSNGIDTNYFQNSEEISYKTELLKEFYKIPKNYFIFLFVGRIVKDKGINELIEAFSMLNEEHKEICLLLVGEYEHELDPIDAKSKNIIDSNSNIVYCGYQSDVRPVFAASDVFVFPSYREGFPNVVLQAGAMEVPSIVSDINGCNEIIQNRINGLIVPVKSVDDLYYSMKDLYLNRNKLVEMKKNCRSIIVEKFNNSFIWLELLKEYQIFENKYL